MLLKKVIAVILVFFLSFSPAVPAFAEPAAPAPATMTDGEAPAVKNGQEKIVATAPQPSTQPKIPVPDEFEFSNPSNGLYAPTAEVSGKITADDKTPSSSRVEAETSAKNDETENEEVPTAVLDPAAVKMKEDAIKAAEELLKKLETLAEASKNGDKKKLLAEVVKANDTKPPRVSAEAIKKFSDQVKDYDHAYFNRPGGDIVQVKSWLAELKKDDISAESVKSHAGYITDKVKFCQKLYYEWFGLGETTAEGVLKKLEVYDSKEKLKKFFNPFGKKTSVPANDEMVSLDETDGTPVSHGMEEQDESGGVPVSADIPVSAEASVTKEFDVMSTASYKVEEETENSTKETIKIIVTMETGSNSFSFREIVDKIIKTDGGAYEIEYPRAVRIGERTPPVQQYMITMKAGAENTLERLATALAERRLAYYGQSFSLVYEDGTPKGAEEEIPPVPEEQKDPENNHADFLKDLALSYAPVEMEKILQSLKNNALTEALNELYLSDKARERIWKDQVYEADKLKPGSGKAIPPPPYPKEYLEQVLKSGDGLNVTGSIPIDLSGLEEILSDEQKIMLMDAHVEIQVNMILRWDPESPNSVKIDALELTFVLEDADGKISVFNWIEYHQNLI